MWGSYASTPFFTRNNMGTAKAIVRTRVYIQVIASTTYDKSEKELGFGCNSQRYCFCVPGKKQ